MSILLALLVFVPLFGAAAVAAAGRYAPHRIRHIALTTVWITLLLAVPVVIAPPGREALEWHWLDRPAISFALGVDGISMWLVGMTALLMPTAVLVSWESIRDRQAAYYAMLLVLEAAMLGVFMAMDVILFYIFFEFTLIPLFFIIGFWGGKERRRAASTFFIYTLAGSVLTFLGLLYLVVANSNPAVGSGELTFSIPVLLEHLQLPPLSASAVQWYVFLALFAGFAIKVPMFPFHTWLPLAHVEAPTAGSVLLAGVLLKIGSYGFVRFSLPLLPDAAEWFMPLLATLAVIGILYGALIALAQDDIKRLVAYSSVSHMGFCMLGLVALNPVGVSGAILVMVAHGLATGGLFALVGMLYERYHTRQIDDLHGLAKHMPIMTFFLVLLALSSLGLPGLAGFVGEVMALLGMFYKAPAYAILATAGIVLAAWYMLWLVERIFFGPLREPRRPDAQSETHDVSSPRDLSLREIAALAPLAVFVLWIGIFPRVFLDPIQPEAQQTVARLHDPARQRGGEAVRRRDSETARRRDSEEIDGLSGRVAASPSRRLATLSSRRVQPEPRHLK
jgi:NADH-quinone oxidoreductase subunit M